MEIQVERCNVKWHSEFDDRLYDPLLEPFEQDYTEIILNAQHDDCVCKVFRKVDFSTLNVVAGIGIHFNRTAKQAFLSKYVSNPIHLLDLDYNHQPTFMEIDSFFREFGSSDISLSLLRTAIYSYSQTKYQRKIKPIIEIDIPSSTNKRRLFCEGYQLNDE